MVTTLDIISKGRAILGIGAAWYELEHDGFGFAFPRRRRATRPARGGRADLPRAVPRRAPDVRGPLLLDRRRPQRPAPDPARRAADHDRRERREAHAAARRAVRRHVQRDRRPGDRRATSSTCCARTARTSAATRRRSRRPGSAPSCSRATPTRPTGPTSFLRGMAGDEFDEQFTVGEADEVVDQVGRSSTPGLDCLDLQHAALRSRDRRPRPASCSRRTSRRLRPCRRASPSASGTRPTRAC